MKRCPQCEFIYEDDQSCCDMDGIDLVFEHATPPAAPQKMPQSGKRKTSRSFLSVCAVVFGVLFLAIGYASLERAITVSSEPASFAENSSAEPAKDEEDPLPVQPAPVEPAEEKPSVSPEAEKTLGKEPTLRSGVEPKPTSEPLHRNSVGTRGVVLGSIPPQNRVETSSPEPSVIKVKPAPEPAQKDSKVVSIVKKTGRLLKKPFKL